MIPIIEMSLVSLISQGPLENSTCFSLLDLHSNPKRYLLLFLVKQGSRGPKKLSNFSAST
jgi:hypothetical protein